jgi:hypothetical protein
MKHLLLALALVVPLAYALGGTDGLSAVPTPGVLPHSAYQLYGQFNWHRVPEAPGTPAQGTFPWVTGVRLGLFDRGEFGAELGRKVSLSGKVQFLREEDYMPAFSFGTRSVFHSSEAHLYSVPDSLQAPFANELFLSLSKTFRSTTGFAGISVIPGKNSQNASPFWGLDQNIGAGFSLVYDGFQRNSNMHHNAGISWNFRDVLRISTGANEIDRFFYQNEQFGFYNRDHEKRSLDGYSAPGVWFLVSFTGSMRATLKESTPERLVNLEKRIDMQNKRIEALEKRNDRSELQVQEIRGRAPDSLTLQDTQAEQLLSVLVRSLQSEAWNPRHSRKLQDSLLGLGEVAYRMIIRTALRESSSDEFRLTAIRIMGSSQTPRFIETLGTLLVSEREEIIRESLLALAKIGNPEALDMLRKARPVLSPELQKLIDTVIPPSVPTVPAAPPIPAMPVIPN